MAFSDVRYYTPLKFWIVFWITVGILSYTYTLVFYKHWGPKHAYEVSNVKHLGGITEIYFTPKGRRLSFEPGMFVFLRVEKNALIPPEYHPFTISSDPSKEYLRLSFKPFGDYTKKLVHIKKGTQVSLYGPYGEFSSYVFNPYKKQIWIAGGVGITPFLSMLGYEVKNGDKKDIDFIYAGHSEEDCTYKDEIEKTIKGADDNIKFITNISKRDGHLSAHRIKKMVHDIEDWIILICGPGAMVASLKDQLVDIGMPEDRIVFEEFDLV